MRTKEKFFFFLFLTYILLLSFLLFVNDLKVNYSRYPLEDKVLHYAAFFFGQLLIFFAGKIKGVIRYFSYSLFLLLPVIAEIVQQFLPRRVSDVSDMLAAYFGITTCIILWYLIKFLRKYFFLKER